MMKKLFEYLPLYYGSPIYYPDTNEWSNLSWTHLLEVEQLIKGYTGKNMFEGNVPWKLVLRRFYDMTKTEAMSMFLAGMDDDIKDILQKQYQFAIYYYNKVIRLYDGKDGMSVIIPKTTILSFCEYSFEKKWGFRFNEPESFRYMLSINVDLFDLIDEKIAIDLNATQDFRKTHLPDDDPKLNSIREDLLTLFEQSVGWKFRIKGSPLVDVVAGIDRSNKHVCGKMYGNFHVDLCELTNEETQLSN